MHENCSKLLIKTLEQCVKFVLQDNNKDNTTMRDICLFQEQNV